MVCYTLDIGFKTNIEGLILGKTYDIVEESNEFFQRPSITYKILVVNIEELHQRYNSLLFKELSEWRKERLEKIGV